MPEVCRFYGIVIRMYFDDHPPPHFHVRYGEFQAVFGIDPLILIGGNSPWALSFSVIGPGPVFSLISSTLRSRAAMSWSISA